MSEYTPDRWVVMKLRLPGDTYMYKIFATWYGGFAAGDSWKLNSGIVDIEDGTDYLRFHGYSGSVYCCHAASYGTSGYGASVLNNIIEPYTEDDVQVLSKRQAMEWINDYLSRRTA